MLPVLPRAATRASLVLPALDREAALGAFVARDGRSPWSDPAARRAHVDAVLARGERLDAGELFRAFPEAEAVSRFFAREPPAAFFPPDEVTLRYLLVVLGERLLSHLEAWAAQGPARMLVAEMGSRVAARAVVGMLVDPLFERADDARAWMVAHPHHAVVGAVELASRVSGDGGVAARAWLAERPEIAAAPIVALALDAGDPPDPAAYEGSPARTARWFACRFGAVTLRACCPPPDLATLDALLDPARDAVFEDVPFRAAPWWPGALGDLRELAPLLERALRPDHPELRAAVTPLPTARLRAAAVAVLDAFIADKAKPMLRWAIAAALALAPEIAPVVARHAATWGRSHNRNHRALVRHAIHLLRDVGTDEAIARIALLAESSPHAGQREDAMRALEVVALDRGVPVADVIATAVPDLGIADDGTMRFDFGPRAFVARLGSSGSWSITDEGGGARSALPKPGKRDDPALAAAAHARFAELVADTRHVVRATARGLEEALRTQRRWSADVLASLARQPLLRSLLRGLVFASDACRFRIADDGEWLTLDDRAVAISGDVWLAHPLDLSTDERVWWGQVLSDHELVQPCEQLSRPTFGADVSAAGWLVPTGSLVGLLGHGWTGSWSGGGALAGICRAFPGGSAQLAWAPFVPREVGAASTVTLGELELQGSPSAIVRSELLLDLDRARRK